MCIESRIFFENLKIFFYFFFSDLSDLLGGSYAIQYFFAAVSLIAFFFALIFLPETHGKKLSEIEAYFKGKSGKTRQNLNKAANAKNRKPKPTLQTVNESEKMMDGAEIV